MVKNGVLKLPSLLLSLFYPSYMLHPGLTKCADSYLIHIFHGIVRKIGQWVKLITHNTRSEQEPIPRPHVILWHWWLILNETFDRLHHGTPLTRITYFIKTVQYNHCPPLDQIIFDQG